MATSQFHPGRISAAVLSFAVAAVAAVPASAGDQAQLTGQYAISVSGFKVAQASFNLAIDGNAYSAAMQASSAAVGRLFSKGTSQASASGLFRRNQVQPLNYRMDSQSSKLRTHVSLAMRGGNIREDTALPPLRRSPDRIEVNNRHKRNVVDPLSAAIMPVSNPRKTTGPDACRRTLPVFDGWTRYDVKLQFTETRNVTVGDYQGPVAICTARFVPIAGHRTTKSSVIHMRDHGNIEAWIAPIGETRYTIPVRVKIDTPAGNLVVSASRLKVTSGVNRQASK